MRPRCGLALAIAAVLLPSTLQRAQGEGADLRVLFPADQSVLESGRFELLAVLGDSSQDAPPLRIDGKLAQWLPYTPPALVARLDLKPGRHEIAVGPTKLAVHVRGDDPLPPEVADWPVFRSHPGGADGWKDCASCHEVTEGEGRQTVGAPNEPAACQACHTPEDFQLAHFHPPKPLAGCHNCHALHGSAEKSLLKGPTKKLCAACHDT